jgi:hypothetical protein
MAVTPGDKVVTSGDAKAFPPGLPVGQVVKVEDGAVEVELYAARDKLQYVSVADYGLLGILAPTAPEGRGCSLLCNQQHTFSTWTAPRAALYPLR